MVDVHFLMGVGGFQKVYALENDWQCIMDDPLLYNITTKNITVNEKDTIDIVWYKHLVKIIYLIKY